jgi:predicted DNA-binding protein
VKSDVQILASAGQAINVGRELRQRLEAVAREQGADGTYLGRRIVREYVEQVEREASLSGETFEKVPGDVRR